MNWTDYLTLFDDVISRKYTVAPYDNENYFNYTALNQSRQNRWLKRGEISSELRSQVESITEPQEWILITEPWCGDAAHCCPFIHLASELNEKIDLKINLRDGDDSLIQEYLTNGTSMSIPILVARDADGNDLFVWGPRPKAAQEIVDQQKTDESLTFEDKKIALQEWYNGNKGEDLQGELLEKLRSVG